MADERNRTESAGNTADILEQEVRSLVDEYLDGPDDIELDSKKLATLLQQLPESRCLYERGLLAQETEKPEEALLYYQQAVLCADASKKADIYFNIASCQVAIKDSDGAIESYKKALQADNCCVGAAQDLGALYAEKGDWEEAIRYYQQALPNADADAQADLHGEIASCHKEKGDWREACSYLEQVLGNADKPAKPRLWVQQGRCYFMLDEIDKATECYRMALKTDTHCPDALEGLGQVHFAKEDYSSARQYFEQAVPYASDEDKTSLYCNLGDCHRGMKDIDAAIKCYRKALEVDEHSPDALDGLGQIHLATKGYSSARQFFEQAIQWATDEQKPDIYYNLGVCLLETGDRDTAIDCFVRCLDADEQNYMAAWELGDLCCDDKNWKQALGYYQQAARYASDEDSEEKAGLHFMAAVCYSKIKDQQGAVNENEACLALAPDYPIARNNLGWALRRMGRYDEAVAVFREAIKRGKDGRYPLRNLVTTLRKLKRYSEAIDVLKQDVTQKGELTPFAQKQMGEVEQLLERREHGEAASDTLAEDEVNEDELEEVDASIGLKDDVTETSEPESDAPQVGPVMGEPLLDYARAARITRSESKIDTEDVLEGLMEKKIERNQKVFGRRLRMFEASDSRYGRYGRQFAIPGVGRIDLLTVDLDTNELVVIELKRDRPERKLVGQITEYMGWVRENLAAPEQKVQGIICVWETTESLRLAVSGIPNLEVFQYELSFEKIGP